MAGRGAPAGNVNAHKGRRFRAMLDKALRADPKQLERLAKKLLSLAEQGEGWALREVADRLDGRPVAQVDLDVSVNPSIAEQFERAQARMEAENRRKGLREVKTVDGETILIDSANRPVDEKFAKYLLERLEQFRNPGKPIEPEWLPALEHKTNDRRLDDLTADDSPPQAEKTMSFLEWNSQRRQPQPTPAVEIGDESDLA